MNYRFKLTNLLTTNIDTKSEHLEQLLSHCSTKTIKKGNFLLQAGEYCSHSFFVENGLLRQYSISKDGKEHIIQFAPENWFIVDRDSVFFKKPSSYFIQAIEDTTVLMINEQFLVSLSQKDASFNAFNNQLLHSHIRSLQKRINLLLGASAEERYLDFIKTYPDIMLRVPQIMVDSYLGVTPESLSRVRRALAEKHR